MDTSLTDGIFTDAYGHCKSWLQQKDIHVQHDQNRENDGPVSKMGVWEGCQDWNKMINLTWGQEIPEEHAPGTWSRLFAGHSR